jgi:hypothetical protein
MAEFIVSGPCMMPITQAPGGKLITKANRQDFWRRHPVDKRCFGCYIFARKAGKGYTPLYVGKSEVTFEDEIFQPHKLSIYAQGLAQVKKGTYVFFFLCYPHTKGTVSVKQIRELETFLIQTCKAASKDLLNIKGTGLPKWEIEGITSPRGKPPKRIQDLKRTLNLTKK